MELGSDYTILITGATDGLGKALALKFAASECRLLLHGRNREKGDSVLKEIIEKTGNTQIDYYNADFASLSEVKKMGGEILQEHTRLDLLFNNAAIGGGPLHPGPRELSRDGIELRFAVNYLAHFALTNTLLPVVRNTRNARIVLVSSIGQSPLDFDDLMMEKTYDSFTAYCRSKLAQIIYGYRLAKLLKADGVTVNSVHPATLMPTNMVSEFFGRTASTIDEGVDALLYVCCSPLTKNITGEYFNQKKSAKANPQAYDTSVQERLWSISEQLVREKPR